MDQKTQQKLINLRKNIHQQPQLGFQEVKTRNKVISTLLEFGVQESQMTKLQPTALYVDLRGKGEPSGSPIRVAFRADMDALPMAEANDLPYRSHDLKKAHMCGHDGHTVCLLGLVPFFMKNIGKIPSDKVIRLLFQPSEQGPESGALKMIKDGCLNGVDQVYGFHQVPVAPLGYLWCKEGPVMSESSKITIKIIGTGGHGSDPQNLKYSLKAAVKFYQRFQDYIDNLKKTSKEKFECTLPVFQAGERFNVISESVVIQGSIRSFKDSIRDQINQTLVQYLEDLRKEGFKYQFNSKVIAPINSNTKVEAEHVLHVGKKFFGEGKAGSDSLPILASQDFGYFTQKVPGAFFFLASTKGEPAHSPHYVFDDGLIKIAGQFWWELAKYRLNLIL